VAEIAEALKDFKNNMIFIGGAVVSLYADDPAADEIRPTKDVDLTIDILNLSHWVEVQEKLGGLGFYPDPFGHAICSYKYKDIPVDIMSMTDGPLGPANPWYKIGYESLWRVKAKDQEIQILSAPCYLATKFEAFNNRGKDYRTSHDIEDIIYILDNRTSVVAEVLQSDARIRQFIAEQLKQINRLGVEEVLIAHVHPLMSEQRMPMVIEKINALLIT
jgi:hypothetical protein